MIQKNAYQMHIFVLFLYSNMILNIKAYPFAQQKCKKEKKIKNQIFSKIYT